MNAIINKIKTENEGQMLILFVLAISVLLGFAAITIDVGTAYATKANLQNTVDAAAMAGAQDLAEPNTAMMSAALFAEKNGIAISEPIPAISSSPYSYTDSISGDKITITTPYLGDSTMIEVICERTVKYSFAKILGISDGKVTARAVAQYGIAASVPWIVPFVIPQPIEFNYDNVYVMRMYGGGPYPYGYQYPYDYRTDAVYKNYPISGVPTNIYTTIKQVSLKKDASMYSNTVTTIPTNKSVTYNFAKRIGQYENYITWYNITYNGYTGYIKEEDVKKKTLDTSGDIYPYHFDYMNVHIKNESNFNDYIKWLEYGYHDTFSVNEVMYYYAPSSGGRTSVDAFNKRIAKDSNTDYTKAKIGDARVILIPVVNEMLSRTTRDGTPMEIIGFTAFFIEEVHKNSYGTSFWFEGRFLKDLQIESSNISADPNSDFGLRIMKIVE
ncbi:pilus assembly protein TadG-related protein [Fusibacter bizertensis]|uniref:Pilus assembly protein TadG-related protein n=1 Tax=Fusibacter bizertensis TaxID=1488331 RepID=A0ABT6NA78_9FIRM|nr:pilus assembly protein TadG-related protein [Fusibacter bizertensis]MDH8677305.1 pilus assembly protein TadG-related protein [Fusibacter bizertensis]